MVRLVVRAVVAGILAVAALLPSPARAFQVCANWAQVAGTIPNAPFIYDSAAAYDSARDRVVMFGGIIGFQNTTNNTWEFNGSAWVNAATTGPAARWFHSMAYDSARGVTVLFGGAASGSVYYGDTWEWNGAVWVQRLIAGPSARFGAGMTYDSARGRIVLFGGISPGGYMGDIWEYNGTAWTNVTPGAGAAAPTARGGPVLAYDSYRQRTVMFGGGASGNQPHPSDTWEWDGGQWTEPPPMDVEPPGRGFASMAYDAVRRRVVVFGGEGDGSPTVQGDTWEYDGRAWVQLSSGFPAARWGAATAYDSLRGRMIICGGVEGGFFSTDDTFALSGDAMPVRIVSNAPSLNARSGSVIQIPVTIAYSGPAGTVSYQWKKNGLNLAEGAAVSGSNSPTLQVVGVLPGDSGAYTCVITGPCNQVIAGPADVQIGGCSYDWALAANSGPAARMQHAMAYCGASGKTVLSGGNRATGISADTWEYDVPSASWTFRSVSNPPGRNFAAMSSDSVTGLAMLFGGLNGAGVPLGDTWLWDGLGWARVSSGPLPSARVAPVMAFDPARNLSIAGFGVPTPGGVPLGDTAQLGFPSWAPTNVTGPRPRSNAHMAYCANAGGLVLFGGTDRYGNVLGDTWRLNSAGWTKLSPRCSPSPRSSGQIMANSTSGTVVLFGGADGGSQDQTWEFDGTNWRRYLRNAALPGRVQGAMAYDPVHQVGVLFGGLNGPFTRLGDTWHWRHDAAPSMNYAPLAYTLALAGASLQLSITATGSPGPYYQWYFNGNPMSNSGAVSGTQTNTLAINPVSLAHAGHYECHIFNECGAYPWPPFFDVYVKCNVADIVSVGGNPPPDGLLTPDDYIAFINAFSAYDLIADVVSVGGQPPPDGLLTGDDFNAFINAFSVGCP